MKTILPLQLLVKPSKKDPQPLVLFHGRSCPDGFAAALAENHTDLKPVTDFFAVGEEIWGADNPLAALRTLLAPLG